MGHSDNPVEYSQHTVQKYTIFAMYENSHTWNFVTTRATGPTPEAAVERFFSGKIHVKDVIVFQTNMAQRLTPPEPRKWNVSILS